MLQNFKSKKQYMGVISVMCPFIWRSIKICRTGVMCSKTFVCTHSLTDLQPTNGPYGCPVGGTISTAVQTKGTVTHLFGPDIIVHIIHCTYIIILTFQIVFQIQHCNHVLKLPVYFHSLFTVFNIVYYRGHRRILYISE